MNLQINRALRSFVLPILLLIGAAPGTYAAVPDAINYQGIARKPDGAPIGNQLVKIRATIRRSTAGGTISYQETHSVTTTAGGQFAIKIGQGTPTSGSFPAIAWSSFTHFLQTEIDPAGGNAFLDLGAQQLVSVPYARHANTSESTNAVLGSSGRLAVFTGSGSTLGSSILYQSGSSLGLNDSSPSYTLDVSGTARATTGLISGADVVAAGNVTVASNKGIVRSQNGTQLKLVRNTVTFTVSGLGANGFIDSGALNYEDFGGVPTVVVGGCTVQNGDWYKVAITPINVTATQCQFRLFNTSSSSASFSGATWQVLSVGAQ